ncbi:hypothetical protein K456DRAFT_1945541, partial [Colletotrichum gloeosporioides 23]
SNEFEGSDFSNNLFSDLAPLLTLFGERVTVQFLSLSMGWADNILLACGPLGIVTVIISAIRIGGGQRLKALIGRARESRLVSEQELLSSTSEEVCELWDGQQVVRVIGAYGNSGTSFVESNGRIRNVSEALGSRDARTLPDIRSLEKFGVDWGDTTPNLTLNARNSITSAKEMWAWTFVGILLQAFAIIFAGLTTHYWEWSKAAKTGYGFSCFCAGTILLVLGMAMCSHIIEGLTTEYTIYGGGPGRLCRRGEFFTLQQAMAIGDQRFPSCAVFLGNPDTPMRASRRNGRSYGFTTSVSVTTAIVGYVVQFVGLRGLHWSATIFQLGVTLLLTAIRAWVRRGIVANLKSAIFMCPSGHELDWLTLYIIQHSENESIRSCDQVRREGSNSIAWQLFGRVRGPLLSSLRPLSIPDERSSLGTETYDEDIFQVHARVSSHFNIFKPRDGIEQAGDSVCTAIEKTLELLSRTETIDWTHNIMENSELDWIFNVSDCRADDFDRQQRTSRQVSFRLRREGEGCHRTTSWTLKNRSRVQAALSLSLYTDTARLACFSVPPSAFAVDEARLTTFKWIVGHGISTEVGHASTVLQSWLGMEIRSEPKTHLMYSSSALLRYRVVIDPDQSPAAVQEICISTRKDIPKALLYAQELFSLFILALAENIKQVKGVTEPRGAEVESNRRQWKNSVFDSIAEEAVKAKLAQDIDEAYTLIIPAFAKYNLLPTGLSPQDGIPSGIQADCIRTESSEESALQDSEVRRSSPPEEPSVSLQDSKPQQTSTQQVATLHQEPSGEQGSPIHRHPSRQSQFSEPGAAQPSEEASAQPTQAVISRPSSVGRSSY